MPVLKSVQWGAAPTTYHRVWALEIQLVNGLLVCKGRYLSYADASATSRPESSGTITGVPFTGTLGDPLEAFERACVNTPGNPLYGGTYTTSGSAQSSLEVERALAWGRIKVGRDAHLDGGVSTPYGVFDSDLVSIVNILGAAATLPEGATMAWILKDNTAVTLTRSQVADVGSILAAFRSTVYAQGSSLRDQVEAAETAEAVKAVVWAPPA